MGTPQMIFGIQSLAYKQWGVATNTATRHTFPIAFTTKCFAVMVTANLGSNRSAASSAWQVDSTSALLFVDTTNVPSAGWYYAIGVQQWGTVVVYSNLQKYTFVIPFNEMCFYCGGIPWKVADAAYCGVAYTVSKTEFEMYYHIARGAVDVCWIAIGA